MNFDRNGRNGVELRPPWSQFIGLATTTAAIVFVATAGVVFDWQLFKLSRLGTMIAATCNCTHGGSLMPCPWWGLRWRPVLAHIVDIRPSGPPVLASFRGTAAEGGAPHPPRTFKHCLAIPVEAPRGFRTFGSHETYCRGGPATKFVWAVLGRTPWGPIRRRTAHEPTCTHGHMQQSLITNPIRRPVFHMLPYG